LTIFSQKIAKLANLQQGEKKPRNVFIIKWQKNSQKKAVSLSPKPYTLNLY
jgi:hypothetical protein